MLNGKLRIAPTCYHVLHLLPVMAAHEMNFFYDAGLKTSDGSLGYEIVRDAMVPFGLEKLGISQAMKEKSIDIALDVQSRTIFFQRARGADVYIIAGWRNQHTNAWVGPPHIKSLKDLKGKRVGISDFNSLRHWAIQIQLSKAGLDIERDVEWVRCGVSEHLHVEALKNGKVECAPVPMPSAESLREGRLQYPCRAEGSVPEWLPAADHRGHGAHPRGASGFGQELSQRTDSLLLVRARYAEEFRVSL